jgi:TM2 domain-containing membrane protein YozV
MDSATKAALLSALIFPGCGQIYLKKYKRGIAIIIPVGAGLLSLCWAVIQVAIGILESAPFKKGTVTFSAVIQLSIDSVKSMNMMHLFLILLLIVSLWIFSIADAYLLAKKQKREITITTPADQQ